MSNSEDRIAALEAEVRRLKAKDPKPPKSGAAYVHELQATLDQQPNKGRNALTAELDKGTRAREIKELREAAQLIRRCGGTPAEYTRAAFTKAWVESDMPCNVFQRQLLEAAKLEAEETETGKGPEKAEK